MRRITLFLVLTIASVASLIATVTAGYYVLAAPNSQANNWGNVWNGMMGGMMGGYNGYTGTQGQTAVSAAAPYFGVAFIVLAGVAVVGVVGLIYFIAFPEIKKNHEVSPQVAGAVSAVPANQAADVSSSPYETVFKTLTANERKVVEVLKSHDGKYLQKYIRSEAALSRLQTHRIVSRLADREIVSLEKTGNTNTVLLADWLK